jgi:hypothetical protein
MRIKIVAKKEARRFHLTSTKQPDASKLNVRLHWFLRKPEQS